MRNPELLSRLCGGYPVAVLSGELDTTGAESAAGTVAALTADGRQLILDLETLGFIDCHAVGELLGVRRTARQAGGDVLLAAPHGPVQRLLTVLDVSGVYISVAAAADSAGKRDARRRAVSSAQSGGALAPDTWYRRALRRAAVPGSRAGDRSRSTRWLRARIGLRG